MQVLLNLESNTVVTKRMMIYTHIIKGGSAHVSGQGNRAGIKKG